MAWDGAAHDLQRPGLGRLLHTGICEWHAPNPPLPICPQNNYPETLGKTLIINAPSMFAVLFKAVKPMLDARTQAKIKVCSSSYLSELRKYVDDENIPSYLGGRIVSVGVGEVHQTIRKGFMPWALCIAASCRGS